MLCLMQKIDKAVLERLWQRKLHQKCNLKSCEGKDWCVGELFRSFFSSLCVIHPTTNGNVKETYTISPPRVNHNATHTHTQRVKHILVQRCGLWLWAGKSQHQPRTVQEVVEIKVTLFCALFSPFNTATVEPQSA